MRSNAMKLFAVMLFLYKVASSEGALGPTQVADLTEFPYIVELAFRPEQWYQTALAVISNKYAFGGMKIIYPSDTPGKFYIYSRDSQGARIRHRVGELHYLGDTFLVVKTCKPFTDLQKMNLSEASFQTFDSTQQAKLLFFENTVLKYKTTDVLSYSDCSAKTFASGLPSFDSDKHICSPEDLTAGALNFTSDPQEKYLNDFLIAVGTQVEGVPLKNVSHRASDNALDFPIMYASVLKGIDNITSVVTDLI
ncbi:uncharacterized protein LOC135946800 [Cloeon dipterum]|uniref:uncharacterized protein LOC135946800 n=1 Tax=Cloeon dipterum TaxID=197152 RepID=UPI00322057A3